MNLPELITAHPGVSVLATFLETHLSHLSWKKAGSAITTAWTWWGANNGWQGLKSFLNSGKTNEIK